MIKNNCRRLLKCRKDSRRKLVLCKRTRNLLSPPCTFIRPEFQGTFLDWQLHLTLRVFIFCAFLSPDLMISVPRTSKLTVLATLCPKNSQKLLFREQWFGLEISWRYSKRLTDSDNSHLENFWTKIDWIDESTFSKVFPAHVDRLLIGFILRIARFEAAAFLFFLEMCATSEIREHFPSQARS